MLRLRSSIRIHPLPPSATSPSSSVHRLLSAATPSISSPNPSFAVENYLVGTCGLTPAQALKACPKLSHLKSPTNPDAVLAFLAGLGLSRADVAAAVAKDPQLLCTNVEKTLSPVVAGLSGYGLSHGEISHLLGRTIFRCRSVVSNLPYYMSLFCSVDNRVQFLKNSSGLLGCSLEKVVKPNVAFLRECGLGDCDISKLCLSTPRVLGANQERIKAIVACAEGLGVARGSAMFRYALQAVAYHNEEKIAAQVEYIKNTFRWSDAEVGIALCKAPKVLMRSKEALQSGSKFLFFEVGLEPTFIAHHPALLSYSLEGRLRPRYHVMKFLKQNGLLDPARGYYNAITLTEKVFVEKFISPHNEAAPHLLEDYAAACRGEVPTNFRFA